MSSKSVINWGWSFNTCTQYFFCGLAYALAQDPITKKDCQPFSYHNQLDRGDKTVLDFMTRNARTG
jgi:hypothetical protein